MTRTFITYVRFSLGWMYTLLMGAGACLFVILGFPKAAWLTFCRPWGRGAMKLLGISYNIHGRENYVGPALFVSNHQSLIDVATIPGTMPRNTRLVAKKELAKIPFWGWAFAASGAVLIDRKNTKAAAESIQEGLQKLPAGWSILIFPEGTRSPTAEMRNFKRGVFHIALASRMPIVPIGMSGTHDIVPPHDWLARAGHVELTVGRPISTEHWRAEEIDQRMAEIREAVQNCLNASEKRYQAWLQKNLSNPAMDLPFSRGESSLGYPRYKAEAPSK